MKKRALIIGSTLGLIVVAYLLPMALISDGTNDYSDEEHRYASQSLDDVTLHMSSPSFYKLYTTKLTVGSLTKTDIPNCPYHAYVYRHTYLGFKSGRFSVFPGCSVSAD